MTSVNRALSDRCEERLTRETGDFLLIDEVFDRYLDLIKVVEDIQLGEVQGVIAVNQARMLHHHQVKPTTAPATASGRTVLAANFLEVYTYVLRAA